MKLPPEKLAELQAERDWILWKMEESKKWKLTGDSEFSYSWDPEEYHADKNRLSEIKKLLKPIRSGNNGH
ncbi:MAG: hypothetical protein KDC73_03885 [Ignavibacteriae bacterium]|nr:hypothetical protein [Ignavibacteriota bacterium]MCB0723817.1 hypothetical protein [Ignavibacteriota bacterium]MCB9244138.1 hypothetical protein [Ignavibacteriales bacterium]